MKKKLLYLLLLFSSGITGAQIVNIPDPVFKNWLLTADIDNNRALDENDNPIVIDANGDYEIQESEALLVWSLILFESGISDATGIEAFSNLRYIECSNTPELTYLDLTDLSNLERFVIDGGAGLESLNLAGLSNLQEVYILGANYLTAVDLTGLTAVEEFTLSDAPVTSLNFSDMINLQELNLHNTN